MEKQTYYDDIYEINHVNYTGGYNGDDVVCQVKRYNREIAHCTWHPGNTTPNRHGNCVYKGQKYCLDK